MPAVEVPPIENGAEALGRTWPLSTADRTRPDHGHRGEEGQGSLTLRLMALSRCIVVEARRDRSVFRGPTDEHPNTPVWSLRPEDQIPETGSSWINAAERVFDLRFIMQYFDKAKYSCWLSNEVLGRVTTFADAKPVRAGSETVGKRGIQEQERHPM